MNQITIRDFRNAVRKSNRPGISTAEYYLRQLAQQHTNDKAAQLFTGSPRAAFSNAIKQARSEFTFHQKGMELPLDDMEIDQSSKIDKGAYAEYEAIIGTRDKDWDGDIVDPYGYDFDMKGPCLWMHSHGMPVGSIKSIVERDENMCKARFRVADTALGRDAVKLMQVGALRKSIGFKPITFAPLGYKKDAKTGLDIPDGFHVKNCKILENSLVSVPSNMKTEVSAVYTKSFEKMYEKALDGIRTINGRGEFEDENLRFWAKTFSDGRNSVVRGWSAPSSEKTVATHGAKSSDVSEIVSAVTKAMSESSESRHAPSEFKTVSESELQKKFYGVDGYLPGSLEDRIDAVNGAACRYCKAQELCSNGYCYVVATFADSAIVAMRSYGSDSRELYQVSYTVDAKGSVSILRHAEIDIKPMIVSASESEDDSNMSPSAVVAKKFDLMEKRLNVSLGEKALDSVSMHVGDSRLALKKSIAELMISDNVEGVALELRQAAESFERLQSVKQLRVLLGSN